jgi:hypothetical protein
VRVKHHFVIFEIHWFLFLSLASPPASKSCAGVGGLVSFFAEGKAQRYYFIFVKLLYKIQCNKFKRNI